MSWVRTIDCAGGRHETATDGAPLALLLLAARELLGETRTRGRRPPRASPTKGRPPRASSVAPDERAAGGRLGRPASRARTCSVLLRLVEHVEAQGGSHGPPERCRPQSLELPREQALRRPRLDFVELLGPTRTHDSPPRRPAQSGRRSPARFEPRQTRAALWRSRALGDQPTALRCCRAPALARARPSG